MGGVGCARVVGAVAGNVGYIGSGAGGWVYQLEAEEIAPVSTQSDVPSLPSDPGQ